MKFYIGSGFKNCELVKYYAKKLIEKGWHHTYNWANNINNYESMEDLIEYSILEQKGIKEADVVIILLPAGRGTHIELGMALALNKKIFLCSATEDEFSIENTVNFYQLPSIVRLVGTADENIAKIVANENSKKYKLDSNDIKKILNWEGADGCLATDRITVDGCKVGYMYREKPDNNIDSGWRFFEGTEDEEYTKNPANIGTYKLNTICNYDADIIPFLNAPYGVAYRRDENGTFVKDEQ